MKNVLPVITAALTFCILGGPSWGQDPAGVSSNSTQNAIPSQSVGPANKNDIAATLHTDKASVLPGRRIQIAFRLTNQSKSASNYSFSTGQQFDVTAVNKTGQGVWHWSQGRSFSQSLTHLSLAPGQTATFHADWNGLDDTKHPLPFGTYTLNARLTADIRPAIRGSVVVDTTTDPNNMGVPTRTHADTGAVQEVQVNSNVTASTAINIGPVSKLQK